MASKKAAPEGPVEVPEIISILPLRNSVLFPGSIIPIDVGRKKSVKLVEEAISKERPVIGIVTQRDARTEDPGPGDLYMVGCAARILKVIKLAKDNFSVILQGVSRIRLLEIGGSDPFMTARVQALPDPTVTDVELDALVMNLKDVAKRVDQADARAAQGGERAGRQRRRAGSAVRRDHLAPGRRRSTRSRTCSRRSTSRRGCARCSQFLSRQHEVLKVREKINSQVQEEMGRNQREYVLRQQLKAIKEELGEIDETGGDLDEFREKIVVGQDAARDREGRAQAARAAEGDAAVVGRVHGHAHLPRVAGRAALVDLDRGQARHPGSAQHPQHRPLRPREGEEAHPRVPGGAQAQERQEGPDPVPGGAARRRQDVARPVDRARARAQVHPHLARRRARRGRDPRPPAHLRRLAARPPHPGDEEGRVQQPGVHARRDRQAGARLPRRPGGGAARGAGPGAELHVLGPLPRGPVRPVQGDVRRDGEHHGPGAAGAARPARGAGAARLHARGEALDLEAVPGAEAARGARTDERASCRSTTPRSPR